MASESWARSSLEREPAKNEPRVLADGADPSAFHIDIYLLSRCVTYLLHYTGGPSRRCPLLYSVERTLVAPAREAGRGTETVATGMHLAAGPSEPA